MPEVKRASTRWRPSDGKGKVVGLYICTMRRYAPSQYRQVLFQAPTAALYYISSPTTASTFALACCDDFCQRRAKLYLTYCKRAFGKPQSGKSAQQARANAYFFRRSVASRGNSSAGPHTLVNKLRRPFSSGCTPVPSAAFSRRQKKVCARAVNLFDKFPQVKYNCHINRIFANISTDLGPVSFYRIAARCDYWTQNSRRNRQGDFCFLLATGSDSFANLFFCFPIVFYRVPLQANMLTFFRD